MTKVCVYLARGWRLLTVCSGEAAEVTPIFVCPAHVGCVKALGMGGDYLSSGSTDEVIKYVAVTLFNMV